MQKKTIGVSLAIIISIALGIGVSLAGSQGGKTFNDLPIFLLCGILAFLINWLAFVPANLMQTERFYDLTGSITYVSLIVFAVLASQAIDMRAMVAAAMVIIWAARLGSFLFIRIMQDGKDDRFDDIKQSSLRFFLTWTLQGLWVIFTAACALAIITSAESKPLGIIGMAGIAIWLIGFLCEAIADRQKRVFRRNPDNKGKFIQNGLWSWSRHPNYFGEITLWVGMAILALPVLSGWQYLTLISPIFVYLLITKISGIPMLQKKADDRWGEDPEYQAYLRNTSRLFPLPPKQ